MGYLLFLHLLILFPVMVILVCTLFLYFVFRRKIYLRAGLTIFIIYYGSIMSITLVRMFESPESKYTKFVNKVLPQGIEELEGQWILGMDNTYFFRFKLDEKEFEHLITSLKLGKNEYPDVYLPGYLKVEWKNEFMQDDVSEYSRTNLMDNNSIAIYRRQNSYTLLKYSDF